MTELNPDSRMQRRGVGDLLHPAQCAVCGNGTCESGYIDIGVYYDYEGQVYLCMNCVNEIANVAGLLTDTEVEYVNTFTKELAHKNEKLENDLKVAHEKLEHYDSLFGDRFNQHPDVIADLENAQRSEESADGPIGRAEGTEPITDESVISEEPTGVSGSEQPNGIDL